MPDRVDRILDQWATERPDIDPAPMGIVGRISGLAKLFHERIAANLAAFDLTPDEFDVLATLRRNGEPFALNPRDLIASMMVGSGTVTHRLDKLESRGLIERSPDPADRRCVVAALTPRGRELIDRAVEAHVEGERALLSGLDATERRTLTGLLRRLSDDCEAGG